MLKATLTLPSIAGFVLSMGMAVDANVLIFERFKEEYRSGKSLRTAMDAGFSRALSTIFDSNVNTLLAAMVLYTVGTGSIKGFAITLGLGILLSMFTAVFITRLIIKLLLSANIVKNGKIFGAQEVNGMTVKFDIIGKRYWWFAISTLILIPGFLSMAIYGFNLGIDFTGGNLFDLKFDRAVTLHEVREGLKSQQLDTSTIQLASTIQTDKANNVLIRTRILSEDEKQTTLNALKKNVGNFETLRSENVGAVIGSELTTQALLALLCAAGLMIVYLSWRFEFKFAVSGIVAIFHDILIVLGVFFNFQN